MTFRTPVYFDNNSTTPIDPRVLEAMLPVFREQFGNPASKTHAYGWFAEELVTIAREQVAETVNVLPEQIVFTSGATESINLALNGLVRAILSHAPKQKPHVLTVATEHRASLDPLRALEKAQQIELTVMPVLANGALDMKGYKNSFHANTALVSIMLANNEIGTLHDIATLADIAHSHGAIFHCDATQAVGKLSVDAATLGADLLSFSSHKVYGPKGAGALAIRIPPSRLQPLLYGGGHELGLRSGTLNVPAIVGFGLACSLAKAELDRDRVHLEKLTALFLTGLRAKLGGKMVINGGEVNRLPGNLNLAFLGTENSIVLGKINTKVACSVSSACQSGEKSPSHVLQALGISEKQQRSSLRFGFGRFNTEEEVLFGLEVILQAILEEKR